MLKSFDESRKKLKKGKPQCYETAEIMFNSIKSENKERKIYKSKNKIKKSSLNHLYKLMPSFTTIELNIEQKVPVNRKKDIMKKYGIKNRFWIPRVFNHSFNILITKKYVILSQSWFKVMNYKIIDKMSHESFLEWLDIFRESIKNYNNKPSNLFSLFRFFEMSKIHPKDFKILNYIKSEKKEKYINLTVNTAL